MNENYLKQLRRKAFLRRSQLQNILSEKGHQNLIEISKSYNVEYGAHIPNERKQEFIDAYVSETKRLLGPEVASSCETQLSKTYRVTTTDHHGPLSEPGMVNGNLHEALPYLNGDDVFKNILVLGCANVSFDNETFPRGLLLHNMRSASPQMNQLVFFSRSVRARPVMYFPAFTTENTEKALNQLTKWEQEGTLTKPEKDKVSNLINNVFIDTKILNCNYFTEQVTIANYRLWKQILSKYPQAPNLVYIEQERLVNRLLVAHHLTKQTLINQILFSPAFHDLLIKYFDGIDKAFSINKKRGTFLFWALPKGEKYRVQLWKHGEFLSTDDRAYSIPLTPDGIKKAIENEELIPSTQLSFMLLAFYYGVKLTGGTNQTSYLTDMQNAYIQMLRESGSDEGADFAASVPTKELSLAIHSLAFLKKANSNTLYPATAVDLIMHEQCTEYIGSLCSVAENQTLSEVIDWALPDAYRWYYGPDEREPDLERITKDDMALYLKIESKLKPFII